MGKWKLTVAFETLPQEERSPHHLVAQEGVGIHQVAQMVERSTMLPLQAQAEVVELELPLQVQLVVGVLVPREKC